MLKGVNVRLCLQVSCMCDLVHVTPPPTPSPQKWQNSNNDSIGIHSVKVLVQVHYFYFEHGCPVGVPICTRRGH